MNGFCVFHAVTQNLGLWNCDTQLPVYLRPKDVLRWINFAVRRGSLFAL